ncbi:MAG: serine/threonine-protein kinase [Polyangiaceae bacterium]
MAESPVELGSVIAGRYRIDRALGAGTMGVVVAAWHLELEQAVAIKFLNPSVLGATEALERFRREARAAARIKSEHVVRVLDVGAMPDGLPFIVMELLHGRSLEDELLARGPLPVSEAVSHVLQAIDALAEAHAGGIVHRDLKPANLFVSERADRSVVVKVLDFGISKVVGDAMGMGLTRTGMIVGSPLYMAPEQLRSTKSVDQRADVWALGTILYQLLTGRTPYNAESAPDLYAMLLRDPPTPITTYRTDLPDGVEATIMRCLERDPDRRFQNVGELADSLTPIAPPSSRIHAERARRVLMGVGATSQSGPLTSLSAPLTSQGAPLVSQSAPELLASPPQPLKVSASTDGGGPLIVTNRKTLRSGGETQTSSKAWLPIAAAGLLLFSALGYFVVRRVSGVAPDVNAAQAQVAAAAVLPAAPLEAPPAVAAPAKVEPAPPEVQPVPTPSAAPSAPTVEPVNPAAVAAAHRAPVPLARAPLPAAPKPAVAPAPAPVAPAAVPSTPPQPSVRALSNFGGRK